MAFMLTRKKQSRETLEAQRARLQKEKEQMKTELDELTLKKEAAQKKLNELEPEESAAHKKFYQLNYKLGEAEKKVKELQMDEALTERLSAVSLLPGILNEITLAHIWTKLSWSDLRSLRSVNHSWQNAIHSHSRQLYDARVSAQSTETFVCVTRPPHYEMWKDVNRIEEMKDVGFPAMIVLYSFTEDSCCKLPPIPKPDFRRIRLGAGGLPACCQCVSLDGKVYVLGGTENPNCKEPCRLGSAEVYVLDVAGQRPWKKLARMQEARMDFAACVMDGRIYVLGGRSSNEPVHGSEVYDPEADEWSSIKPMTPSRFNHQVVVHGKELVVFYGDYYDYLNDVGEYHEEMARDVQVYHPAKNKWRVLEMDSMFPLGPIFTSNEKAYLIYRGSISTLVNPDADDEEISWTNRRENSFPTIDPLRHLSIRPLAAVGVNDEVLAMVKVFPNSNGSLDESYDEGTFLFQSIGFNTEDNNIGPQRRVRSVRSVRWQKRNRSLRFAGKFKSGSMFCIQL